MKNHPNLHHYKQCLFAGLFAPALLYFLDVFSLYKNNNIRTSASIVKAKDRYCALASEGYWENDTFHLHDSNCNWGYYPQIIQGDFFCKQQHVNVLLIGDSQERNTVDHFCRQTGGKNSLIQPRWTLPNKTTIRSSGVSMQRVCKVGNVQIANFFHFGFVYPVSHLVTEHASLSEGEPIRSPARFQQVLPNLLEDAFGGPNNQEEEPLIVVMNSGLWDMLALAKFENWQFNTPQFISNGTWAERLVSAAAVVQNVTNASLLVWRNVPDVVESRTEKFEYILKGALTNPFTHNTSRLLNDAGVRVAKGLGWPILDLRGSIAGREEELIDFGGWHIHKGGIDVYLNRILNTVVSFLQ